MARFVWKIDGNNQVTYKPSAFGKSKVLVNGEMAGAERVKKKTVILFTLSDGRSAEMKVDPGFGLGHDLELFVGGQAFLSEMEKKRISCIVCGRKATADDRFCQKCGAEIPAAENQHKLIKLKGARGIIAFAAFMFLGFGLILYFVKEGQVQDTLGKLASYKTTDIYPKPIDGKQMTVGELRQEIQMESLSVLGSNLILAAIMMGLYFYSRRSPLVSFVAAMAIYLSVIVLNAIVDPATIGQGIIMKIFVIGLLVKGIQSALELRKVAA